MAFIDEARFFVKPVTAATVVPVFVGKSLFPKAARTAVMAVGAVLLLLRPPDSFTR